MKRIAFVARLVLACVFALPVSAQYITGGAFGSERAFGVVELVAAFGVVALAIWLLQTVSFESLRKRAQSAWTSLRRTLRRAWRSIDGDVRDVIAAAVAALAFGYAASAVSQTIISKTVVPTPSGVVSDAFLDGDDGTAGIPLVWATVPNFVNKIEGTPFSVDLRQYLTEPGTPDATLSIEGCTLPTGWTLDVDDLEYDGTGTGSATCVVRATRDMVTSDSNQFTVESVAAESTDATAPTIITGVTVTLDGSNDPVISFDAAVDVRVTGEDVSGVDTYTVLRGATPLTPQSYTGTPFVPDYSYTEVGTVANNNSVQDGADWDLTGEGSAPNIASLAFAWESASVTGDFTITTRIDAITGGTDAGRGGGICVRDDATANSRQFCTHMFAGSSNTRCYHRAATGATIPVQEGVINETLPVWHRITRVGNVWTAYVSGDGNAFGELCTETFAMNQTVLAGPTAMSNQAGTATTVSYANVTLTTRPRQSFTDTSGVPGSSSYTVISTDVATNVAAASTAVVAPNVPAGSQSDTPDYVSTAVTLLGQTPVAAADLNAFTAAIGDADCGETVTVALGVTITGSRTIAPGACAANQPYILRCAISGAVEGDCPVSGAWTITGDNVTVSGFDFNGAAARIIVRGDNFRFIGNRARNWSCSGGQGQFINVDGDNADIDGTEIAYNHIGAGAAITGSFCWPIKVYYGTTEASVPTNGHIHHNYCQGTNSSGSADDRSDCIEMGEGSSPSFLPTATFGWYIEDNYFCDFLLGGDAVVDSKFGGTVIRRNTGCDAIDGRLSLRMGSFSILESNWWPDTNASNVINTNGRGHKVVCNRSDIWVLAGTDAWNVVGAQYAASFEVDLDSNIGDATIGRTFSNHDTAADETEIRNHTGTITRSLETDTTGISPTLPQLYDCPPAFALTTSEVGPGELSSAGAAYLANRGLN